MPLPVSCGLKIRSDRLEIVFGRLTAVHILFTCLWSVVVAPATNAASLRPVAAENGMAGHVAFVENYEMHEDVDFPD